MATVYIHSPGNTTGVSFSQTGGEHGGWCRVVDCVAPVTSFDQCKQRQQQGWPG